MSQKLAETRQYMIAVAAYFLADWTIAEDKTRKSEKVRHLAWLSDCFASLTAIATALRASQ